MKKLQITLCTLLAVTASFHVHAAEPGKIMEHTVDRTSTVRQNDHQLTEAQKNKAAKDSAKQIDHDTKYGKATEGKYTQRINELTDSPAPLTSKEAQELAKNQHSLKTIQDQNSSQSTTGISFEENEAPAREQKEQNKSNTETRRTDSTDSLKTVDLNDSQVVQDAQNVKDTSTLTSFIKSMVDSLFGKDTTNAEVQDAMDQAMSDAQAEQWWSPWDGSKFQRWYDNTMENFRQIKNSLSKSLSTKDNDIASKILDGFTSVDLFDEHPLFYDSKK